MASPAPEEVDPSAAAPHDPFNNPMSLESIQSGAARNVAVNTLTKGLLQGLQLLTLLVMARLLSPADFGVVAMVMAAIGIADLFRDLGLPAATLRLPRITHSQVNTLFWINTVLGAVMMAAGLASAALLPALLANPRVSGVAAALSVNFLINGLAAQHLALLRRNLRFADLARMGVISALMGSGLALALGICGAAYWALVASAIGANLMMLIGAWQRSGFRPGAPAWDPSVRPMMAFGGNLVIFGLFGYVAQNLQNVLLGRFRGAAAAGLYTRATALMNIPLSYALEPLRTLAPATMARLGESSPEWRRYYLDTLSWLVLLVAWESAGLVPLAPDFVTMLLGSRWHESGEILSWLALASLPQVLCSTTGWLYLSRGNSRGMMRWGIFGYTVMIAAMFLGIAGGALGVATMFTLSMYLIVVPCLLYATRGTSITLTDIAGLTWRPALAALVAGCAGAALLRVLPGWTALPRILAAGALVTAVYFALLAGVFGQRAQLLKMWLGLRTLAGRPAAATP